MLLAGAMTRLLARYYAADYRKDFGPFLLRRLLLLMLRKLDIYCNHCNESDYFDDNGEKKTVPNMLGDSAENRFFTPKLHGRRHCSYSPQKMEIHNIPRVAECSEENNHVCLGGGAIVQQERRTRDEKASLEVNDTRIGLLSAIKEKSDLPSQHDKADLAPRHQPPQCASMNA